MDNTSPVTNIRPKTEIRKRSMMEAIAAYVDAHLAERITLKAISSYCGVSVSTITQMFQKKANLTFHQYLTQRRMYAAQQMIHAGTALEEVGRKVGYMDHSTFYRAFRQTFGMSPREYKKQITLQKAAPAEASRSLP